jgi:Carboxypeptidase regulatory-like domain
MRYYRCLQILLFASFLAFFSVRAMAQSTQSTILGTIRDSSGAVIAAAQVKIVSLEEGVSWTFASNELGAYLAPDLKPGHYRITESQCKRKDSSCKSTMTSNCSLARKLGHQSAPT